MIRCGALHLDDGPRRAGHAGGSRAARRARGRRAALARARGRGPWRRRRRWWAWIGCAAVSRRGQAGDGAPGSARVRRAAVPPALYPRAVGPAARARAPHVPASADQRVLPARRGAAVPRPARRAGGRADQRPGRPHASTSSTGTRWGMFGFLEFEDDPEVLRALLDAAEGWLRERGLRPDGRPDGLHA